MIENNRIDEIMNIIKQGTVREQELMKQHTTFRIGGPARLFVQPYNLEELQQLVQCCRQNEIPYFILGNGSNLLVSDRGYEGVVIQLCHNMERIESLEHGFRVQAGALLSSIAAKALQKSLTGFEFASGIPGTVGGAVVMNAGAYGGEMKQIVESVTVLNRQGEIEVLNREQLEFGYRTSSVLSRGDIVLEAVLLLQPGEEQAIRARMDELRVQRKTKQPLEYPSAGSTFKRPEGNFAGKLIMDAGFRGYQVGGARVSDRHCGFVINAGDATAEDVLTLTTQIREKVQRETGVSLELEVKLLGKFS